MVERIIDWRQLSRPRGRRRHGTEGGRRPWGWEPVSPARAHKAPTAVWASAGLGTRRRRARTAIAIILCQVSTLHHVSYSRPPPSRASLLAALV